MVTDLEFCMVEKLGRAWPSLQYIIFSRDKPLELLSMDRKYNNWEAIECIFEEEGFDDE